MDKIRRISLLPILQEDKRYHSKRRISRRKRNNRRRKKDWGNIGRDQKKMQRMRKRSRNFRSRWRLRKVQSLYRDGSHGMGEKLRGKSNGKLIAIIKMIDEEEWRSEEKRREHENIFTCCTLHIENTRWNIKILDKIRVRNEEEVRTEDQEKQKRRRWRKNVIWTKIKGIIP